MGEMINTAPLKEKAVLVGYSGKEQDEKKAKEYLNELSFLADTAGAIVLKQFIQQLDHPHPVTFVGQGKLNEIAAYIKTAEADTLIFDDELTPTQLRNIEKVVGCKVLDRTNLILDIFAKRAQTAHAKTQVELAQYQYLLPRLTRMWTHLERQRGGIGLRGPGETQIETDRRIILEKIARLKERLKKIDKEKSVQRMNRGKLVRIALVGYTNAGKSTIMNLLSKSEVFAEDKLFATLDTTVRKVVLQNMPVLLADTVGFIRKLPHDLVISFKSTLDEVREADILVHVIDISHAGFEEQIEVVNHTLEEIGASDKLMIYLFNKIDAYTFIPKDEDDLTPPVRENKSLSDWQQSWMGKVNTPSLFISAKYKQHVEEFRSLLYEEARKIHTQRFPYNDFLFTGTEDEELTAAEDKTAHEGNGTGDQD